MRTDDLVRMLAAGEGAPPGAPVARRLTPAILVGFAASAAASIVLLGLIPRSMWLDPAPWVKLAYAGGIAIPGAWLLARLARPTASTTTASVAVLAVAVAMAIAGVGAILAMPPGQRVAYLMGASAAWCPSLILALSLPALGGAIWALQDLAPLRPRLAGFVSGILAGAIGAAGYALSCTEESIAFVALWYSSGILLTGIAGLLLGDRWLRW